MAITFTWSIKDMHRVVETGAVYKVDWSCSGVDADTEVSHSRSGTYLHKVSTNVAEEKKVYTILDEGTPSLGSSSLDFFISGYTKIKPATPDHTAAGFKAYADLTEADVLAWCKADGVGTKAEALITKSINSKIAASANSTGMPWAAE